MLILHYYCYMHNYLLLLVILLLQAITVLNHAGVCVSYQTAWKYVQQLTAEAGYQEVVHNGHWQWVFDNVNMHQTVRHEREGNILVHMYTCTCMRT